MNQRGKEEGEEREEKTRKRKKMGRRSDHIGLKQLNSSSPRSALAFRIISLR